MGLIAKAKKYIVQTPQVSLVTEKPQTHSFNNRVMKYSSGSKCLRAELNSIHKLVPCDSKMNNKASAVFNIL